MKSQVPVVWLIANLLHPFLLIFWFGEWNFNLSSDDFGIGIMLFIYGFMFSMPSLLLGFLVEYLVVKLHSSALNRYLYWLLLSPLVALLNWGLLVFVFGGSIDWRDITVAFPSMIAVLLASLMRYKSFLKEEKPSTEQHEQETPL